MKKQTIAVDIDDVLAANAEGFTAYSNKKWGTKLKPDDYTEHWAELWGIDHDQVEKRRKVIIKDKVFTKHRFFNEAKPILKKLSQKYKLVIVSSRGVSVQKDTLEWIDKEFPGLFQEIHFAKIWDLPRTHVLEKLKMTKAEICREVKADYLIDDQPKHCFAVAEAGIQALLFGSYAWTNINNLPKGITRCKDWTAVLEYFNGR